MIGACERTVDATTTSSTPSAGTTPTGDAKTTAPVTKDAATQPPVVAPTRASLRAGDRLEPIATVDAAGKPACTHCAAKGPTMIVLATATALAKDETWRDLDAMARFYADDQLTTLAVVAGHRDGGLVAGNAADAKTVDATRRRQRIAMPVFAAAATATAEARALDDVPALADDPTVVLLDASGTVAWTGTRDESWQALDRAIVGLVATPASPTP